MSPGLASNTVGPSTAEVPASRPMQASMNDQDGLPGRSTAVRDAVSKRDGDPDDLANASVEATPYEGDGGVTILITIGTTVATHILMGLWDDHVRPRLRKKYERDAGAARERVTQ